MAKTPLTTEEWVRRVNALAREIDAVAASVHPSVWPEQLADLHEKYRRLAAEPTCDPPEQLSLWEDAQA